MKNTVKILLALCAMIIMMPLAVHAQTNVYIRDDADILSPGEEAKLQSQLESYDTSRNYLIVTEPDYIYAPGDMHQEMDGQYQAVFGSSDGVAFIINMSDRQLYTGGFGKCAGEFRSGDARDVTDNVYRKASDGNYYECLSQAFRQIDSILKNGFILRPMRIAVSVLLGLLCGFTIMFFVVIISRNGRGQKTTVPQGVENVSVKSAVFTGAVTGTLANAVMHRYHRSSGDGSGGGGSSGGGGGSSGGGHGF